MKPSVRDHERDFSLACDRVAGASYGKLGLKYGITSERCRMIICRIRLSWNGFDDMMGMDLRGDHATPRKEGGGKIIGESILEKDIICSLLDGMIDLSYPESYADMEACVRSMLRVFNVERRNGDVA